MDLSLHGGKSPRQEDDLCSCAAQHWSPGALQLCTPGLSTSALVQPVACQEAGGTLTDLTSASFLSCQELFIPLGIPLGAGTKVFLSAPLGRMGEEFCSPVSLFSLPSLKTSS